MAKLFEAITTACETTAQTILDYLSGRTFPPSSHTHTPTEAGALPAGGTAVNAAKLGGKLPEYYHRRYNYLDNSNFAVNQRGKSEYSSTGYSYDRWRFRSSNGGKATKLARGIRITVGTSGLCGVYQRIATQDYTPVFDALAGKPVTLAIKIAANTLSASGSSAGIDLLDHNGTTTEGSGSVVIARRGIPNGTTGIVVATGTMPESITNDGITALLRTPHTETTGYIDIEWMALYEGTYTADTLPEYVPNSYVQELLECQRFYLGYPSADATGHVTAGATLYNLYFGIPTVMRTRPTVSAFSFLARMGQGGYSALCPSAASVTISTATAAKCDIVPRVHIQFSVDTAVDVNNSIMQVFINNLELSADL